MPYVLKEAATGELLARMQVNGYQLPYYGVLLWESAPDPDAVMEALSQAGFAALPAGWEPVFVTEHQAKMANVKLRNDPRRRVFSRDGALVAE